MTESIILKGTSGLNNIIDPLRHPYNPETGVGFLAEAVNVDIDDTGGISRRPGQVLLQAGNFHSLFCNKGDCFVVQDRTDDAAIYKVGTDYSLSGVRSGLMKGARVSYWQAGIKTYYSSAFQNGVIENGISSAWPVSNHVGADTSRHFSNAPLGNHLAVFYGRMLIAVDNIIWASEPYAYGKFNLTKGFFQFTSRIRMMKSVVSGLWVSTENEIVFLSGDGTWESIKSILKSSVPAHEFSTNIELVDLSNSELNILGLSAIWSSDLGICIGTDSGNLIYATDRKIKYLTGHTGATCADGLNITNHIF